MLLTSELASPCWWTPPPALTLPDDCVHVWRAPLDLPAAAVARLRGFLAEDELARAERFHFPAHRRHFTVARGTLRMLAGRYLGQSPGQSPEKIRFAYNPYGKPFLPGSLRFNLSHSGEMALYAFARGREVGIDVEWTRRRLDDSEAIVKRFFSPREAEEFLKLPALHRKMAFFRCWTGKEAWIKALGKGLSVPLDQAMPEGAAWTMETFTPQDGYVATLVVEGRGCRVIHLTAPP